MTDGRDPYRVLGVPRDADTTTIRNAFRRLALRHHPDRNSGSREAEERFKTIVAAYETLTDPARLAHWKRRTAGGRRQAGFPDFSSHHPFHRPGRGHARSRPGHDVHLSIDLTAQEARNGREVTARYTAYRPCGECSGRGGVGGMVHCPNCLGFGRVRPPPGRFFGRNGFAMDCPDCKGTAYVFLHPCRACGGDGLVSMECETVVPVPPETEDGQTVTVPGAGHAGPRGGVPGRLRAKIVVGEGSAR